jgi:hypothetical protein
MAGVKITQQHACSCLFYISVSSLFVGLALRNADHMLSAPSMLIFCLGDMASEERLDPWDRSRCWWLHSILFLSTTAGVQPVRDTETYSSCGEAKPPAGFQPPGTWPNNSSWINLEFLLEACNMNACIRSSRSLIHQHLNVCSSSLCLPYLHSQRYTKGNVHLFKPSSLCMGCRCQDN